MDTTYNSGVEVTTRRWTGIGLVAASMVWQIVSLVLWDDGYMSTRTFYRVACAMTVCLIVVGAAMAADSVIERRGFDVKRKDK